jgi:hypothetical protein
MQLPSDLAAFAIDPAAIKLRMAPRRDSAAVVGAAGIDAYISRLAAATRDAGDRAGGCGTGQLLGSCWAFSWDEAMQLVWEERQGCVWEGVAGGPGPVIEQVRQQRKPKAKVRGDARNRALSHRTCVCAISAAVRTG